MQWTRMLPLGSSRQQGSCSLLLPQLRSTSQLGRRWVTVSLQGSMSQRGNSSAGYRRSSRRQQGNCCMQCSAYSLHSLYPQCPLGRWTHSRPMS